MYIYIYTNIYIHIYIDNNIFIYINIYRERERGIYVYIYIIIFWWIKPVRFRIWPSLAPQHLLWEACLLQNIAHLAALKFGSIVIPSWIYVWLLRSVFQFVYYCYILSGCHIAMLASARAGDAALTSMPQTVHLELIILLMPCVPAGGFACASPPHHRQRRCPTQHRRHQRRHRIHM